MKINEIINTERSFIEISSIDFEVSGCVLIHENQFLILKRHKEKPFGGTWCLPAGKKEPRENPVDTLIREVHEEIGVDLKNKNLPKIESFSYRSRAFLFYISCLLPYG
jgi:8-oxo-dGTP pyrophosphatase MutT (NUDIX family)